MYTEHSLLSGLCVVGLAGSVWGGQLLSSHKEGEGGGGADFTIIFVAKWRSMWCNKAVVMLLLLLLLLCIIVVGGLA